MKKATLKGMTLPELENFVAELGWEKISRKANF
jgi:hypothetical protein